MSCQSYENFSEELRKKERDVQITPDMLTKDATEIIDNENIDIVIEVMGGLEEARAHILRALQKWQACCDSQQGLNGCIWL
ncbi:hypothetical protein GCM10020331_021460 [Ectobacillus funiculus]